MDGCFNRNGTPSSNSDILADGCTQAWARERCVALGVSQRAPPTFIDRLATAGYNVSLYGKMHAGGGLVWGYRLPRCPAAVPLLSCGWVGVGLKGPCLLPSTLSACPLLSPPAVLLLTPPSLTW